jgi:hypothetical protein
MASRQCFLSAGGLRRRGVQVQTPLASFPGRVPFGKVSEVT